MLEIGRWYFLGVYGSVCTQCWRGRDETWSRSPLWVVSGPNSSGGCDPVRAARPAPVRGLQVSLWIPGRCFSPAAGLGGTLWLPLLLTSDISGTAGWDPLVKARGAPGGRGLNSSLPGWVWLQQMFNSPESRSSLSSGSLAKAALLWSSQNTELVINSWESLRAHQGRHLGALLSQSES